MSIIFALIISLILTILWILYLNYFVYGECKSKRRLDGKTVLITGGNSGIGFETAKDLAKRGARVIITSENYNDCIRAKNDLVSITKNENIVAKYLDLSSLENVRTFADDILKSEEKIDILINNAGILGFGVKSSKDGILLGLQVNYFGPFLLTHLLIDLFKKARSRIVNVTSTASQFYRINKDEIIVTKSTKESLSENKIYSLSKLYIVFMTWEMSHRLKQYGITINCVHPGLTPRQGAQTTIHCAVSEEIENVTGKYFQDCKPVRHRIKKDYNLLKKFWDKSIEVVKLQPIEIKI